MAIDGGPNASCQVLQESLLFSRAFWVSKSTVAWDVDAGDGSCYLYGSKTANLSVANGEIQGYDVKIELGESNDKLPEHVIERFPHIREYKSFQVPPGVDVASLLKYQLAVAFITSGGECTTITGLQLPGVLDELFSYDGPLGPIFSHESIALYLWAPTAQDVRAHIYREPEGGDLLEVVQLEEQNGVWSASGPLSWDCCYYVYEVSAYHPSTLKIEKCIANDPYARGLSADGERTLLVNLNSETSKPEGWDDLDDEKPDLSFPDISIYELHVRDFSASDSTVHPDFRGGFLAFTSMDSAGMHHLKKLSKAGMTHVHLLPTFQFGGVDDDKGKWKHLDFQILESFPPDSEEQQAQVTAIQNVDGYNWGYNPVLWGVPKGSYARNPNGMNRIIEFRMMVQALNRIGLRVVLDVVYNHLYTSGPYDKDSALDKIVPGYYLRRNLDGLIEHSACMNNTASEHFMVERLIIDDLLNWTVNYKVDGFRFDLMGHIMKRTMEKAKSILKSLSKQEDGVDGASIYLYGEGWDFGEVANNGRGINASQFNLGGTGIGSFNDRIRDAMLGGSPFGHPLQQGFITGLFLEPNDHNHGSKSAVEHMLAVAKDHIQVGMAGNLKEFVLTNYEGQQAKGCEVTTHDGAPVAYASSPIETVNYVSAHDNETLFDIVSLKTPVGLSVDARCRMNHLATSIIALSQVEQQSDARTHYPNPNHFSHPPHHPNRNPTNLGYPHPQFAPKPNFLPPPFVQPNPNPQPVLVTRNRIPPITHRYPPPQHARNPNPLPPMFAQPNPNPEPQHALDNQFRSAEQNHNISSTGDPPTANPRRPLQPIVRDNIHTDSTSFYFTNFPEEWFPESMRSAFQKLGNVKEVFVPQKRNKRGEKFGFVRFGGKIDTREMEEALNNIWIGAFNLKANKARFDRQSPLPADQKDGFKFENNPNKRIMNGKTFVDVLGVKDDQFGHKPKVIPKQHMLAVMYQSTPEENEWLEGCIVAKLHRSESLPDAQLDFIHNGFDTMRIYSVGGRAVMINDENEEALTQLLQEERSWLHYWFSEIGLWNKQFHNPDREAWIRCTVIPLHAWTSRFFHLLADKMGKLIKICSNTMNRVHLDSARLLISLSESELFNKAFEVDIDGVIYMIRMTEEVSCSHALEPSISLSNKATRNTNTNYSLAESSSSEKDTLNEVIPESDGEEPGFGLLKEQFFDVQDEMKTGAISEFVSKSVEIPAKNAENPKSELEAKVLESVRNMGLKECPVIRINEGNENGTSEIGQCYTTDLELTQNTTNQKDKPSLECNLTSQNQSGIGNF